MNGCRWILNMTEYSPYLSLFIEQRPRLDCLLACSLVCQLASLPVNWARQRLAPREQQLHSNQAKVIIQTHLAPIGHSIRLFCLRVSAERQRFSEIINYACHLLCSTSAGERFAFYIKEADRPLERLLVETATGEKRLIISFASAIGVLF